MAVFPSVLSSVERRCDAIVCIGSCRGSARVRPALAMKSFATLMQSRPYTERSGISSVSLLQGIGHPAHCESSSFANNCQETQNWSRNPIRNIQQKQLIIHVDQVAKYLSVWPRARFWKMKKCIRICHIFRLLPRTISGMNCSKSSWLWHSNLEAAWIEARTNVFEPVQHHQILKKKRWWGLMQPRNPMQDLLDPVAVGQLGVHFGCFNYHIVRNKAEACRSRK